MKKAIMFPGQGSQYKGMGKSLFGKYKKETKLASDILGYDIEELCVKDPRRELVKTQFTQPALFVVNNFQYKELNITPDYLIGHSLGEYNALLAADVFDFEVGLKLVQKRGAIMAAASGGSMAAVLGLSINELEEKLVEGKYDRIDIANYNTPTQTVLSGSQDDINKIVKDFDSQDIKIIPLFVSAPFHSRFMEQAEKEFSAFLKQFTFNKLNIPVIANTTARPYSDDQVIQMLSRQISSSVQWSDTIRYLMGEQVDEYTEIGGVILTKMTEEIRTVCEPIVDDIPREKKQPKVEKKVKQVKKDEKIGLAERLGSSDFREDYGLKYSYLTGAMYRGTASKELVIAMGQAGMLGYLGTGGLTLEQIESDIAIIQEELSNGEAYGMNLLHHLSDPDIEMKTVELYLKMGVKNVEAAAYMQMTESLVYFHASGLVKKGTNTVRNNRILAKVSRPEVADAFMRPAPENLLSRLVDAGRITQEQADLAKGIPVSNDICIEADSGGHTDGGVAMVLLPSIQRLREDIQKEYAYKKRIRVGLAGGIGTPQSAACAFVMGADFILTGSINQCTVEAGTSDEVKDLLQEINVQDTDYAPAGDMFEIGAKVQVLKKGVLFPARANKLYNLYIQYNSLEELPEKVKVQLEKNYFKKSIAQVWEETKEYLKSNGKEEELRKAEVNSRHKMALVFRWYFAYSTKLAFDGDMSGKVNFQIHTGPALGAFNQWVKGTNLENWKNRYVAEIGDKLMQETADLLKETMGNIDV